MFKKAIIAGIALAAASGVAFANGGTVAPTPSHHNWLRNFYVGVQGGFSISSKMDFKPNYDNQSVNFSWLVPISSYFGDDMGTEPMVGGVLGYTFNNVVSAEINYTYRSDFTWDRHDNVIGELDSSQSIGERWRTDINIQTLMFNLNLSPDVNWGGLRPFVQGGVGIAWNETKDFTNKDLSNKQGIDTTFITHLKGKTKTNFAWDIGGGVDYAIPKCQNLHLQLGYRFLDTGTVETGTTFTSQFSGFTNSVQQFKADDVQLNEVYAGLNYHFG